MYVSLFICVGFYADVGPFRSPRRKSVVCDLQFSLVITYHSISVLRTHLHLHVGLTRRTSGQAWHTSKKHCSFGNVGELVRENFQGVNKTDILNNCTVRR